MNIKKFLIAFGMLASLSAMSCSIATTFNDPDNMSGVNSGPGVNGTRLMPDNMEAPVNSAVGNPSLETMQGDVPFSNANDLPYPTSS